MPIRAQEGDAELVDLPYSSGFDQGTVRPGQDPAEARLAYVVGRAGTLTTDDGRRLLPSGTVLDTLTFDDTGAAHMWLTAKGAQLVTLPESHVAAVSTVFRCALEESRQLAGLEIQIRQGGGKRPGRYRSLRSLMKASLSFQAVDASSPEQAVARQPLMQAMAPQALGGPVANADGQPVGALSGVVVFCAAGHGWIAGSSSWSLGRGLAKKMVEDYGNIDQLNYFVHYLHNAGATVVPFRPVGYQRRQVVLDNDDPGVTWTGNWINSATTSRYYENKATNSGVPYRWAAASSTETAVARYTPTISKSDFYPVYCFTKHDTDRVPQTYRIRHTGGTAQVTIDHTRVGNGWIWLGNYYFEQGTSGYVEISNQSTVTGSVIADAIRFGIGMGDVVGEGPGRVSGYQRDEEGQRYWAESELGNKAVGYPSSIWDCCDLDYDDNVGTAARWSREMNRTDINNDRWRRIYIEWHSNGLDGTAKGTVALYNLGDAGTTNQFDLAKLLGGKLEADMLALDDGFEYPWGVRASNTYHAPFDYGAINTSANGNEFDATMVEVAFHDNTEDAANLRNAKVRDAVARSVTQGVVKFLSNSTMFPGTQVPNVYLPDPPERVEARHDGSGNIVVSWTPGPSRPATSTSGHAATGFKIYRSSNGYGFGNAISVGNVTSATLSDIPTDTTVYLRVAATNAGGESMPSSTLAVRRPTLGPARVLIVDGFDRVSRQQNYIQTIPAGDMERPIARRVNSFDYVVQHAAALAVAGRSFDSCVNEAVTAGSVQLGEYQAVVWVLGEESSDDRTFDPTEQTLVGNYLGAGGRLFVTGSEIAYELDSLNAGRSFYNSVLRGSYVGNSAGTYIASGSGGILADVGTVDFDLANGAPYDVNSADRIAPGGGATAILSYSGGSGGGAGIQYDSGTYRVVLFGFPFEAITSEAVRNEIMSRVMDYLAPLTPACLVRADFDCDGDVDQEDFGHLQACLTGIGVPQMEPGCQNALLNSEDIFVDQADVELFKRCLTQEGTAPPQNCLGS